MTVEVPYIYEHFEWSHCADMGYPRNLLPMNVEVDDTDGSWGKGTQSLDDDQVPDFLRPNPSGGFVPVPLNIIASLKEKLQNSTAKEDELGFLKAVDAKDELVGTMDVEMIQAQQSSSSVSAGRAHTHTSHKGATEGKTATATGRLTME
eukprot:FR738668.1.p1 GENE.FR738668.1~~FR738668.1.p1  ORF type:complete len:149 (+),score=23.21 FR738668.1:3-449(+)